MSDGYSNARVSSVQSLAADDLEWPRGSQRGDLKRYSVPILSPGGVLAGHIRPASYEETITTGAGDFHSLIEGRQEKTSVYRRPDFPSASDTGGGRRRGELSAQSRGAEAVPGLQGRQAQPPSAKAVISGTRGRIARCQAVSGTIIVEEDNASRDASPARCQRDWTSVLTRPFLPVDRGGQEKTREVRPVLPLGSVEVFHSRLNPGSVSKERTFLDGIAIAVRSCRKTCGFNAVFGKHRPESEARPGVVSEGLFGLGSSPGPGELRGGWNSTPSLRRAKPLYASGSVTGFDGNRADPRHEDQSILGNSGGLASS